MTNLVEQAKNEITSAIKDSINKAISKEQINKIDIPEILIEIPRDKAHGDFATNTAMQMTKLLRKPPREIAQIIVQNMDITNSIINKCEIAGPGFINFYINPKWLYNVLELINKENENYGKINVGKNKRVMVEYISANPTGPMHMGNARGGAIGDCLASVLDWAGYNVTREFYINDAGNQIEKFAKSLETRYIQLLKGEDAVKFPEDGYHGEDIKDRVREFISIEGDKYLNCNSEERKNALVKYSLEKNINKIKEDLNNYGINYDVWFRESSLYKNGEINETIEILKKNGYTYEKEGALWFKASDFGVEKDEVLVRKNGTPTYFAADIAYHRNKLYKRNFDKVINIWGADHHGHVARMKAAVDAIGCDSNNLQIIIMQLVRLMRDGEVARMSKRTGKSITLNDLIEEIGKDAARFFFNMRQAGTHMDFDLNLAVSKSEENPVYYVQYAHARICSIITNLETENIKLDTDKVNGARLSKEIEKKLLKKLIYWPEEVKNSALNNEPSKITKYVIDLASDFHSFYNSCRVKNDDIELMMSRLALAKCIKIVIANALTILGVSAPESM